MSASSTPTFCPAAARAAARFTVTDDVNVFHHAQFGDGAVDLGVVHPGQRLGHLVGGGRCSDSRRGGHGLIVRPVTPPRFTTVRPTCRFTRVNRLSWESHWLPERLPWLPEWPPGEVPAMSALIERITAIMRLPADDRRRVLIWIAEHEPAVFDAALAEVRRPW